MGELTGRPGDPRTGQGGQESFEVGDHGPTQSLVDAFEMTVPTPAFGNRTLRYLGHWRTEVVKHRASGIKGDPVVLVVAAVTQFTFCQC
jgi:hypothetical protein